MQYPVRPKSAETRGRATETYQCVWWEAPDMDVNDVTCQEHPDAVHSVLFQHVQALEEDQIDIHVQNIFNARLFSNRELMAFEWNGQIETSFRPVSPNYENGIQQVCETLQSRIGTHRPKATIVTRGADFDAYLKGRQLDRYLWGLFEEQEIYRKGERVWLDATVYGTGFLKIDIDDGDIFTERVHPDEIIVDQRECVSTDKPMCMYQRKLVSRLWLERTYGSNKVAAARIAEAQGNNFRYTSYRSPAEDQIVVIEAWKLPTRKGGSDGRHVICIDNVTLLDEAYTRERFPFVWLYWNAPETGFYGRSLVGDLLGKQIRLNQVNELIMLGQDIMCVPRLFLEKGSQIQLSQLDNQVAKIFEYRGTLPEPMTWDAFNAEIYAERDRIKAGMFEDAGLSQAIAQNKPITSQFRADSAEAVRELSSQQDERYNHKVQALERMYLEAAKHYIELSKELYEHYDKSKVVFYKSRFLVYQIDWADVDMEADCYQMQIGASSVLNLTPAARIDKLNNWLDRGLITRAQFYALSGEPDLERLTDSMRAGVDAIEFQIDKMLDGEAMTPTAFDDLTQGVPLVLETMQRLMMLDTPPEIITLFEAWLLTAKQLMQPTEDISPAAPTQVGVPTPTQAPMPMDPMMAAVPAGPAPMMPPQGMVPSVPAAPVVA